MSMRRSTGDNFIYKEMCVSLLSFGFLLFLHRHHGTVYIILEEDVGPPASFARDGV